MKNSKIEWTDHTFNPWWGCMKVSEACRDCYAEALAHRWGFDIWGPNTERRPMSDAYWKQPHKWNREAQEAGKRARVFCASMADVFEHRDGFVGIAMEDQRQRLWKLIDETPSLDWLLLTKRPENIPNVQWPSNVWLGCTAENQERARERIPHLLARRAPVHFLSCEPLLGALDLSTWIDRLQWVIVGGESGARSRASQLDWVRSVRDQCVAKVPFHFKQWGNHAQENGCGDQLIRLRSPHDRVLDGRTWDEYPQGQVPVIAPGTPRQLAAHKAWETRRRNRGALPLSAT